MCTCSRVSGKLCAVAAAAAVAVVVEEKVGLKGSFSTSGSCACMCVCECARERERECVFMHVWMGVYGCVGLCTRNRRVGGRHVCAYVMQCTAYGMRAKKCKYIEMSMCKPGMIAIMVPRCL